MKPEDSSPGDSEQQPEDAADPQPLHADQQQRRSKMLASLNQGQRFRALLPEGVKDGQDYAAKYDW